MNTKIAFAELTYNEKGTSSKAFPYASALVASYAKKKFGNKIEVQIFKYPEDFKNYLENNTPKVVCFTNYSWTLDISHEFAKKIKSKFPETIAIFGGPNYPNESDSQKSFLLSYPAIDFYIKGEGELGFASLLENLIKFDFDATALKKNKLELGNCHYIFNNELIVGATLPRIEVLNDIPSPYLSGMLDKFFDKILIPGVQTSRGCPFKCNFCQEGKDYFNKICKFSLDRIKEEIEYISKRVKVPSLFLLDSNFGMYKQDIEIAKAVMAIRKRDGWPIYFEATGGKTKKVMEVISLLAGDNLPSEKNHSSKSMPTQKNLSVAYSPGIAIQSTDPEVLKNIQRRNLPDETQDDILKIADKHIGSSFSEIILCLPGDSLQKHSKSMFDMIDKGANVVRSHQLLLLPDSTMYTKDYRQKYKMETRFRLQPKCFGSYKLYNESLQCAEVDEICVANDTMSYEDYLKCRFLDITVEIFYNNGVFREYINLLNQYDIKASTLIEKINREVPQSSLQNLYAEFLKENKECLWKDKSELTKFIKSHEVINHFIEKNLRANEQLTYRAIAFFNKMEELHNIVLKTTRELLNEKSVLNKEKENYLSQLTRFSLLRKNNLLSLDKIVTEKFNYDFTKISKSNFNGSPFSFFKPKALNINFSHTSEQQNVFTRYLEQWGSSMPDLGRILSRSSVNHFYRNIEIRDN